MRKRQVRTGPTGVKLTAAAAKAEGAAGSPPRIVRADRRVSVSIVDPAGHQHVRVGRDFGDADPQDVFFMMDTLADGSLFAIEDDRGEFWTGPTLDEDRQPRALWFDCKACRDAGNARSVLPWSDLVAAVDALWQEAVPTGQPRNGRVVTAHHGTIG